LSLVLLIELGFRDYHLAALDQTLKYISENSDVWIGWTFWAAGAWWGD
jgi:endoglucanase